MHAQIWQSELVGHHGLESVHALRNLFAVVMSARHLLDGELGGTRRALLLQAIDDAAMRGSALTTNLLLAAGRRDRPETVDINARLHGLEALLRARIGRHVDILFDLCPAPLPVRLCAMDLEMMVIELVANASNAMVAPGRIILRTHLVGSKARLIVADNGPGISKALLRKLTEAAPASLANGHGVGLTQLRRFVLQAHGRLHVRSRAGCGTVIALTLPTILKMAVGASHFGAAPRVHFSAGKAAIEPQPVAA